MCGFGGKPEGRRPLGKLRRRCEDNIKMDFQEVEWGGMDCVVLARDRHKWQIRVKEVMDLSVPSNKGSSGLAEEPSKGGPFCKELVS